ncbi:hypothetical protein LTR66_009316 [Elasticomyces elasticus]|nr:hypothetical protein LTR66_009316 [Elasticomyces elasticus]
MNIYLAWGLAILYWISYPIYKILYFVALAIYYILRPVYYSVIFLAQPLLYLASFIGDCIAWPFRFLHRLEVRRNLYTSIRSRDTALKADFDIQDIYIYLGVGGLVGIAAGLMLHYFYGFLYTSLGLKSEPKPKGPTAKQYRAARKKKKAAIGFGEPMMSPAYIGLSDRVKGRGRGLISQTIMEENDSDY